jgi:RNA polymerase sigma-70 factor (ECF subfamily)
MKMKPIPSDAHLVRQYLAGDENAFHQLYERYERPLYSFIYRYVGDRQSAEDVFQQTWYKALNALTAYKEQGRFSSWILGIAHNCSIDHTRRNSQKRKKEKIIDEGHDRTDFDAADPEEILERKEQRIRLEEAIQKLPEEQREVVLMRIHGEIPFKEIAKIVHSPLNTVLGRMHYAVANLRRMLGKSLGEL